MKKQRNLKQARKSLKQARKSLRKTKIKYLGKKSKENTYIRRKKDSLKNIEKEQKS